MTNFEASPCVLIVDDNDDCLTLTRRLVSKIDSSIEIISMGGGGQAVAYLLRAMGATDGATRIPTHILLDLHMPGINGLDVLQWVRCNKLFSDVKVFMLTTSEDERDIQRAQELGAHGYLIKYPTLGALECMLKAQFSGLDSTPHFLKQTSLGGLITY